MALFIIGSYAAKPHIPIYGAEWDGSSSPAWTRTDDAVGFADPNPYYTGMSGTPSSPFDDIMPWAGMRIVEDASAGTLVEIPKFYYKWTRNGNAMKLQISMTQEDGFLCSPAHMDREDGVGERDYIYVGRYLCNNTNYKSITNIESGSLYRSNLRSGISNLGTYILQLDFATYLTIAMLYLVEYANLDSQSKIGSGDVYNNSRSTTGITDSIPYHTGYIDDGSNNNKYTIEYRYIEDLLGRMNNLIDGVIFGRQPYNNNLYIYLNPEDFQDNYSSSKLIDTQISIYDSANGFIKTLTNPTVEKVELALSPLTGDTSLDGTSYICDYRQTGSTSVSYGNVYAVSLLGSYGGYGNTDARKTGLFSVSIQSPNQSGAYSGSRLMVLPPSRLTA